MAVRNDFTKAMVNDMYDWTIESYDEEPVVYDKLFGVKEMKDHEGTYVQETTAIATGMLEEVEESESIPSERINEGYTTYGAPKKFGKKLPISKEAVKDNVKVKDMLKSQAGTWGEAVRRTLETYHAKFFNYGGYTAGHAVFNCSQAMAGFTDPNGNLCYDGLPLFNLSGNLRSSKGGGTYYNGFAYDLTPANFETVFLAMTSTNNRNERDEVIALMPDVLVVPPALYFTARRILESEKIPGSANNDTNVLAKIVDLEVWQYLTDTNAWFLGKRKKGLKTINRQKYAIDFFYDEDDQIYKAIIDMRYGAYEQNFRFWAGSNFSTS